MMTVSTLQAACNMHPYLVLRFETGETMAVNGRCAAIARRRKDYKDNDETQVVGYYPCSFQEYISRKAGFKTN